MIVWRLVRPEFANALDGEGAALFGGRWNSRGRRAVYTASHLSLAVLEVYVSIPPALRDELPALEAVKIHVPEGAQGREIASSAFDAMMAQDDPVSTSRALGDAWIEARAALVLIVPSVLVPEETNLILNPDHPGMRDVAIVSTRVFRFDPRMVVGKM